MGIFVADEKKKYVRGNSQQRGSTLLATVANHIKKATVNYPFHAFRVFPLQRVLLSGVHRVSITGKAFDLLVYLIENRDTIVSSQQLLQHVWLGINVDASNVRVTVGRLRNALHSEQESVVTIAGKGYQFVAPLNFIDDETPDNKVGNPPTRDLCALQFYLKGWQLIDTRTAKDLRAGINFFRRALELDRNFAQAWAGLGDAYLLCGNFQLLAPEKAYSLAEQAIHQAFALQPNLAEAHASQAGVIADFTIFNNAPYDVSDLKIRCRNYANSGTALDSNSQVIFETIPAGKKKVMRNFSMGFVNSQATKSSYAIIGLTANEKSKATLI